MIRLYALAARLLAMLGHGALSGLGAALGVLVWRLAGSRRRLACTAVQERLSLPPRQARVVARASFRNNFRSFLEIVRSQHVDPVFLRTRVDLHRPDILAAMQEHPGPIIVATAHLGSWEYINGVLDLCLKGRNKLVVFRRTKNRALNELMIRLRRRPLVDIVEHRRAAKVVVERLRGGNGVAAFLVDHNCLEKEAVFLPFLGKVAAVNRGPAMLAVKTRAAVFPAFLLREQGGRFSLHLAEPLLPGDLSGSVRDRVTQVAAHYTSAVEAMVRARPEQWFWMHKRWKTRPPGEAGE